MKVARPWKDMQIENLQVFKAAWMAWWSELQPASLQDRSLNIDWAALQKRGRNGFLLIMVSLAWWGKAAEADDKWKEVVCRVTEVLCCMQRAEPASEPIPSQKSSTGESKKRKRNTKHNDSDVLSRSSRRTR
jgi:hypothetical protein